MAPRKLHDLARQVQKLQQHNRKRSPSRSLLLELGFHGRGLAPAAPLSASRPLQSPPLLQGRPLQETVDDGGPDKRRDRVDADEVDQHPDERRKGDHAIEELRPSRFLVEAIFPAKRSFVACFAQKAAFNAAHDDVSFG